MGGFGAAIPYIAAGAQVAGSVLPALTAKDPKVPTVGQPPSRHVPTAMVGQQYRQVEPNVEAMRMLLMLMAALGQQRGR